MNTFIGKMCRKYASEASPRPLFTQPLFVDKIMEKKRGLELVSSVSLGCKMCFEKFFFFLRSIT